MKPFLSIDLTEDKHNEMRNGREFLVAEPSTALSQTLESNVEETLETFAQSRLPLGHQVLEIVTGLFWMLSAVALVRLMTGDTPISLGDLWHHIPWAFWSMGGCFLAWLALIILSKRRAKAMTEERTHALSRMDTTADAIYAELGVPVDAVPVDVIAFSYKVKAGKLRPRASTYNNYEYRLFTDGEALYLADTEGKYAFPRTALRGIRTVNKRMDLPDWNKDTPPRKGEYEPYKIQIDAEFGNISFKSYHILEVACGEDTMGIYFACYDLSSFEAATGLKAE